MRRGPLRVGVVSAYPPRRDGFAEDARDLVRALASECAVAVCAVGRPGLNYPAEVVVGAGVDEYADYCRAGRVLAEFGVDAVLIRHADGMYGGADGAHILDLAQELRRQGIPRVISLLTVRVDAPAGWTRTTAALTAGASAVLVPTETAREVALARRLAKADQVRVVGVGVPASVLAAAGSALGDAPLPASLADLLRGAGPIIATVRVGGANSQGGLEATMAALGKLAEVRPSVRVVVVRLGRSAEDSDQHLVEAYGLADQVRIVDTHLPSDDLAVLLARAGAYVAIGDDPMLPRAMAAGCPTLVVSDATATSSAADLAGAMAAALDDTTGHDRARPAAIQAAREIGWPAVARRHADALRTANPTVSALLAPPALRLNWLDRDLGRLRSFEPDRDARLAAVAAGLLNLPHDRLTVPTRRIATSWAGRTIRALGVAVQVGPSVAGGARAVWGLGALAAGAGVPATVRRRAVVLRTLLAAEEPEDRVGDADIVLGLASDPDVGDAEWHALAQAAIRIDDARVRRPDWPVFGERLAAGDIRLARALLAAGSRLADESMAERGLESIDWLARRAGLTATADGMWRPPMAGPQRATDVGGFVETLAEAHAATGVVAYARMAQQAMAWFFGRNVNLESVFDPDLGACRVGLGSSVAMTRLSADATLAYLGAVLSLHANGLAALPVAEVSRQDLATVA